MANYFSYKNNKGIALVITVITITLFLFLAIYFLSVASTEKLIARSHATGNKVYYLAEAGINEMVWLIKNNSTYRDNFENDASWTASTTRDNPFGPNTGSYTASIINSSAAHGEIISTGSIDIGNGNTAQRVIRTFVYKAMGTSGVDDSSGYADGNINISDSIVNFYNGSAHSNNTFIINNSSVVNIDTDLKALGVYNEHHSATVTIASGTIYASNYDPPGPAAEIEMPAVDFDSAEPTSYLNIADDVYTENEFKNLMEDNQNLVLTASTTYVTGSVELKGAQTLTINGLLVVEKDFTVGFNDNWASAGRNCPGNCGPSNLYINHASGTPAGIFAGRHVDFKQYTGDVEIYGVVYANDLMNLTNIAADVSNDFDVTGGLIARKLTATSCQEPINITHDNNILMDSLGSASTSPTIVVEHWEEEY